MGLPKMVVVKNYQAQAAALSCH
ncbi:hypothetical protein Patl1_20956 [Pistacia atlantica]|uniref:Uncharacterized protein n=1 Tax=Pistacia atlantica TaxID=434234 RepID=A0ACC1BKZ6_9ROSI|nr:hypothetical protein Patl1_20956 [Pistacia atlantica]